jgi:hypothetical protein
MEVAITVVAEPRSQVVNLDRRTMARADSDAGRRTLSGLLGRCWQELRATGIFLLMAYGAEAVAIPIKLRCSIVR